MFEQTFKNIDDILGKERKEVQQNFPVKTGETAFLFLQHFIKSLRAGGRAAIARSRTCRNCST